MEKFLHDIPGFEDFNEYSVTKEGYVYSYKKNTKKQLKGSLDSKGYKYITVFGKGKRKDPKIHRLVALAFIPNPENKEQINHIDGDKTNNHFNNLEWVTNRENRIHAIQSGLKDEIGYGIVQCDLKGNPIQVFDTAAEALNSLGIKGSSGNIGRVIRGSRKTAYGFIWKQCEGSTTIEKLKDEVE